VASDTIASKVEEVQVQGRRDVFLGVLAAGALLVAAILFLGTAGTAAAKDCTITQDRSAGGTTPATIEFVNETGAAVTGYWLDFSGNRQRWFTLQAGQSVRQGTFIGHAWLVTDSSGTCIGYVLSTQVEQRYVIGGAAGPGASSATFTDPAGDGRSGADLKSVAISNDAAGQITFRIGLTTKTAGDDTVTLCLDADRNAATGLQNPTLCPRGAEYNLYLHFFGSWEVSSFRHYTGPASSNSEPASRRTLGVSGNATTLTVSINRSELGGTGGFDFQLSTEPFPGDNAPDSGTWSYTLQTSQPGPTTTPSNPKPAAATISAVKVTAQPASPAAGSTFTVSAKIVLSTGATVVAKGTCRAKLAGAPLKGTGKGGCSFRLPTTSAGKTLVVTIAVQYRGKAKARSVAYKVRQSGPPSPPAAPQGTGISTPAGRLLVSSVQISDHFPPGCAPGPTCQSANQGYVVLIVWLKRADGGNPGQLAEKIVNFSKGAYVVASDGDRTDRFAAGLLESKLFVGFTPSLLAKGFKLYWPGNRPIALGK
jgi:hypothetical protein